MTVAVHVSHSMHMYMYRKKNNNLAGNLVGNSSIFDLLSGEPKISMTATLKQKPRQKLSSENIAHNECEIKRDDKSDMTMSMGMMRAATRDGTLFGRH